ncbi:hypothetical protein L3Y34_019790 [Caenorhabditis briggsae]|uniref:C2H2-type domain-containing protein n=1 Tax=Caenorhabditis briggsae TaxID=6238 RepID=A0AAE9DRT8_CAEBR|nr:hypothetical protein L3Y34_019790 [Caenorhabditis briggsae]
MNSMYSETEIYDVPDRSESPEVVHGNQPNVPEKPYVCQICGRRYKEKRYLFSHKKNHLGIRNYKCEYCKKMFHTRFERDHHGLTHANERFKYFPCIIAECSQRFQKMKELMKHLRESHEISEENKATCRKCPEEFGKLKQFLIHVSRKHEIGTNVPIFPLFPALTHLQTPEQTLNFGQSLGNSIVEMMNDPDLSALVVPLLPTIQDLMNCDFRELTRRKPAGVLGGSQEEKEDEEDEEEDGEEDDDQEHEEIDTLRLK